jgi:hypothetical protein
LKIKIKVISVSRLAGVFHGKFSQIRVAFCSRHVDSSGMAEAREKTSAPR